MMKIPALPRARGGSVWGRQESVMALIVVLMVVGLCQAGLPCKEDDECRRNVCIFDFCKPRSVDGGPCETNSHCVKTTDTCVNNVCGVKSPPGGTCSLNNGGDCAVPSSTCPAGICLSPTGGDCSANDQCSSSSDSCIGLKCEAKRDPGENCDNNDGGDCVVPSSTCPSGACLSPTGGDCSANDQCSSSSDVCDDFKCTAKIPPGGICNLNDASDCLVPSSTCPSGTCLSPTGGDCSANDQCSSSSDSCIGLKCTIKSSPGGTCDLNDSGDCVININCDGTMCNFESNKAMSLQRSVSASVAVNGFYFVFGGQLPDSGSAGSSSVEMYSPANNSWVTKADIPVKVLRHSVVAIGDFVFLIGGAESSFNPQTYFYRYDTVNNVWSTASDYTQLPSPGILFTTATAVGNTIYWFGGLSSSSISNQIASFDTSNPLGSWTFPTTLSAADWQMSAVTVGKLIYITGGLNGGTLTRVYDTDKPNVPPITLSGALTISRASHASFFNPNDNKIYLVGGQLNLANRDKTVETLDLSASSPAWTGVPSAALNLLYTLNSGGLIGSRFYTAGSISTASSVLSVLELSGSPHWIPFAPSLLPVYYMVVGKIGSSIITAGGVSQSDTTTDTNKYDIPSDSWSTSSATLSPATTQAASAVAGSEMFAFGGAISGAAVKNTKVLNAGQTSWDARADMTYARSGACAAFEGTKVYVYGGRDGSTVLDAMEIYETDPAQVSTFDKWEDVTTSSKEFNNPAPVHNCAAISTGSKILIFGGKMNESPVSRVGMIQSFDIASKKWDEPLPASITPRYFHSATVLNGFVIVSGGTINNSNPVGTVEAFRISTGEVITLPDMDTPRYGHGSVTDGNAVIFVGGANGLLVAPIEKIRPSLPA